MIEHITDALLFNSKQLPYFLIWQKVCAFTNEFPIIILSRWLEVWLEWLGAILPVQSSKSEPWQGTSRCFVHSFHSWFDDVWCLRIFHPISDVYPRLFRILGGETAFSPLTNQDSGSCALSSAGEIWLRAYSICNIRAGWLCLKFSKLHGWNGSARGSDTWLTRCFFWAFETTRPSVPVILWSPTMTSRGTWPGNMTSSDFSMYNINPGLINP